MREPPQPGSSFLPSPAPHSPADQYGVPQAPSHTQPRLSPPLCPCRSPLWSPGRTPLHSQVSARPVPLGNLSRWLRPSPSTELWTALHQSTGCLLPQSDDIYLPPKHGELLPGEDQESLIVCSQVLASARHTAFNEDLLDGWLNELSKLLFHGILENVSCYSVFNKTLGLKLFNVLCDDYVTGVLAQNASHGIGTVGRGGLQTQQNLAELGHKHEKRALSKCFQGKKRLDYIKV